MLPAEGVHTPTALAEPAGAAQIKISNTARLAHAMRQPRLSRARTVTYHSKHLIIESVFFNAPIII